jgi:hypothetical protein
MLKVEDTGSVHRLIEDEAARERMSAAAHGGSLCITPRALPPDFLRTVTEYLSQVGRHSLPSRYPTLPGCPNHHRIYRWDDLSYVKGCFHQFSFFPWNEDVFGLFHRLRPAFRLRNLLNGVRPAERFLGQRPEDDCIARIAFHFYPGGCGAMNKHIDPVGMHQKLVPVLIMSKRGRDYEEGGLYYESAEGWRVWADEVAEPGDIIWAYAEMAHGVELIDPGANSDWLSFRGRWSAIIAVNKMVTNRKIGDAVDLESPRSEGPCQGF